jgi:hypothetical protein
VRVLVPRPRERAEPLCFLLEDEGAEVLAFPLLELEPPSDPRPLQAAAELLRRFGWVAFASERAAVVGSLQMPVSMLNRYGIGDEKVLGALHAPGLLPSSRRADAP